MLDWLSLRGLSKLGDALFAAAPTNRNEPAPRPGFLWYLAFGLLSCAIVIGVVVAVRLWREIHEDEEPATNEELLAEFRQAHAAGEIDEAEFQRVTALLTTPGDRPLRDEPVDPRSINDPNQVPDRPEPNEGANERGMEPNP